MTFFVNCRSCSTRFWIGTPRTGIRIGTAAFEETVFLSRKGWDGFLLIADQEAFLTDKLGTKWNTSRV